MSGSAVTGMEPSAAEPSAAEAAALAPAELVSAGTANTPPKNWERHFDVSEIDLTGGGLPAELEYNAFIPAVEQAWESVEGLKRQVEQAQAELAAARVELQRAGDQLVMDPADVQADEALREASYKAAQAEARIRAYEKVVIPAAEERLEAVRAQRKYLRQMVDCARAEIGLEKYKSLLPELAACLARASVLITHARGAEEEFFRHLTKYILDDPSHPAFHAKREILGTGYLVNGASDDLWRIFRESYRPQPSRFAARGETLIELADASARMFLPVPTPSAEFAGMAALEAEKKAESL